MQTCPIDCPRHLALKTSLSTPAGMRVASPRTAHGQAAAKRIHQSLLKIGIRSELLSDPPGDILKKTDSPMIVVGNLADSRCVRELYCQFLCVTDLWYPGPGGYELRTLCDPVGSGFNVILVGYSDAEGLRAGMEALFARLTDPIPHLAEIKAARLPMTDSEVDACRQTPLPATAWEIANSLDGDMKGYLYYLTGDPELGAQYRKVWKAFVEAGYVRTDKMSQPHLYSLMRLLPWRLVEDMNLFSEEDRLDITRFIHGWAESDQGVLWVRRAQESLPGIPRHNHEFITALALAFAADYFAKHFPGISQAEHWRQVAGKTYKPYGQYWKDSCDGLCHGWWLSQPVLLQYGLLDPEHVYFERGGARKAADCALAVVNNDGWMPSAGNADLRRQFPGPSLRVAAMYYNDGRYRFVNDLAPANRRLPRQGLLPRAFDAGIPPVTPEDCLGVTVIPVDPQVYGAWEKLGQGAMGNAINPPSAPIERCFDKIAVRVGWKLQDDYLLIDGLNGGAHSYDDACGILDYARLGLSLIVTEDGMNPKPVMTIVRNGEIGQIPGFAALEANETDTAGCVYLRLRLEKYAGADWVREVFLQPGKCLVVHDTVIAHESGDYAVESLFRIPARLTLAGREARCKRHSPCVGDVAFRMETTCAASALSMEEIPVHIRYQNEADQKRWKDRYRTDELALTALTTRVTGHLAAGESLAFAHLAQVCEPDVGELRISEVAGGLLISGDGIKKHLKVIHAQKPAPKPAGVLKAEKTISPADCLFKGETAITAFMPLPGGHVAVGTGAGRVSMLDPEGHVVWAADLAGPVHDIGVATGDQTLLVAGHGSADLTAFDIQGRKIWDHAIVYEQCPHPYWQLPTPVPVQVAGIWHDEEAFFVVGCGDITVRGFDAAGRERWRWPYRWGVPGCIRVADVDGSGKMSIVVGGKILCWDSTCRILDPQGNQLAQMFVQVRSTMTALAFGEAAGGHYLACGASQGANLHLFKYKQGFGHVEGSENRFDANFGPWEPLWIKRLGGQVSGIEIVGTEQRMIAGTSQGFLICYDLEGSVVWHKLFAQGIQHVMMLDEDVLVADRLGGLVRVGLSGKTQSVACLPGACSVVNGTASAMYFVVGKDLWSFKKTRKV